MNKRVPELELTSGSAHICRRALVASLVLDRDMDLQWLLAIREKIEALVICQGFS